MYILYKYIYYIYVIFLYLEYIFNTILYIPNIIFIGIIINKHINCFSELPNCIRNRRTM